jgi:hypothetical protein
MIVDLTNDELGFEDINNQSLGLDQLVLNCIANNRDFDFLSNKNTLWNEDPK